MINKLIKHYKLHQQLDKHFWIFKLSYTFLHDKWDIYFEIDFGIFKFRLNMFNGWDKKIKDGS